MKLTEDEIWGWEWVTFSAEPERSLEYASYKAPSGMIYLRTTQYALCSVEVFQAPQLNTRTCIFAHGLKNAAREAVAQHERRLKNAREIDYDGTLTSEGKVVKVQS